MGRSTSSAPLAHETASDGGRDGFRYRHQQMWRVGRHAVEVVLRRDAPVSHHEKTIGLRLVKQLRDGEAFTIHVEGRRPRRRGCREAIREPAPNLVRSSPSAPTRACAENPTRLAGGDCQFSSVTSRSGPNGGAPAMAPANLRLETARHERLPFFGLKGLASGSAPPPIVGLTGTRKNGRSALAHDGVAINSRDPVIVSRPTSH